ncbi:MAG TPA: NmrA family NAD(P)-binding protein [Rubellimicrobium sp.]|nr:NmrA family NAD(P)-binding protein [Rubellimicrobium sp.]
MTQTILLVGATGHLGSRVAHHLQREPGTLLCLLARPTGLSDPAKARTSGDLFDNGAEVIEGDLADPASLDRAARGAAVVVSCVQGGPETILDGQIALAEAARRQGVRRVLPSDFALDFCDGPTEPHLPFDLRSQADARIAQGGLEVVHVLNGGFMDVVAAPFAGILDREAGAIRFWGTGEERFDLTSVEGTARFTARAALDRDLPSGKFAVSGSRLSFHEMADAVEAATGQPLRRESLGSVEEPRRELEDTTARNPNPYARIGERYQLFMLTVPPLRDLQNDRYDGLRPESFHDFAQRQFGQEA